MSYLYISHMVIHFIYKKEASYKAEKTDYGKGDKWNQMEFFQFIGCQCI